MHIYFDGPLGTGHLLRGWGATKLEKWTRQVLPLRKGGGGRSRKRFSHGAQKVLG